MARLQHQGVVQRYFQFLQSLPEPITALGIAFSGGPDSCALAVCAAEALRAGKLARVVALHVDHGVRPESAADAGLARELAERLGLEFHLSRLDLQVTAGESELRNGRYVALERAVTVLGLPAAMTGHHRRDQAETVLLHLLRGSGLRGVAGMDSDTALTLESGTLRVLRPFLEEEPAALEAVVKAAAIEPLIDPTNLETNRTRNRIRHLVLPALREVNPEAERHLAQFATVAAAEDAVVDSAARVAAGLVLDKLDIRSDQLELLPVGLQRRVVRFWLSSIPNLEPSFERIEAVRGAALAGEGGISIELGSGWVARQHKRRFTLQQTLGEIGEQGVES